LKNAIGQMSESYPYVVLDNEAGLENLSRRIVQKVNLMVMIADPSKRGLETVKRLHELALEMNIEFDKLAIVVNRLRKEEMPEYAKEVQLATGADYLIGLPNCDELADIAESGGTVLAVSENNSVVAKIDELLSEVL
jgi:CO dehydrogenase maturation factor